MPTLPEHFMRTGNYLYFFFPLLFTACKKSSDNCPTTGTTSIATNRSVIYEGSTLSLSATTTSNTYTFQWSGPGGWSSNQAVPVRTNMQASMAGNYSVNVFDVKNCLVYFSTKNIAVVAPPNPPCTVTNNTVSTTKQGVGPMAFPNGVSAYAYQSGYSYVASSANNEAIGVYFSGTHAPYPGIYRTVGYYGSAEEDFVYVLVSSASKQFRSKGGDDVYVNNVAGKLVVTFCNLTVYEFGVSNSEFLITGKLTPF